MSYWENVDFVWEMKFNSKWKLVSFSNWSWHYRPYAIDKKILIDILNKNNLDTSNLNFIDKSAEF